MEKAAATIFACILLLVFGALGYQFAFSSDAQHVLYKRFEKVSQFPRDEVKECLIEKSGWRVFAGFETVGVRGDMRGATRGPFLSSDGARLDINEKEQGTLVRFSSNRAASPEELDLLDWCVARPDQPWLRNVPE